LQLQARVNVPVGHDTLFCRQEFAAENFTPLCNDHLGLEGLDIDSLVSSTLVSALRTTGNKTAPREEVQDITS